MVPRPVPKEVSEVVSEVGSEVDISPEKGYLKVPISSENFTLRLELGLSPRYVRANPLVRETVGKVCVVRGPLVYCME